MLMALVNPSEEIVNSRLYFRCSLYQDYYFVDLKIEGGAFTAVAPQAEESCPRVHYYGHGQGHQAPTPWERPRQRAGDRI